METKPIDLQIVVIIPAFNEAQSIGKVLADIPSIWVNHVIVVNNGSSDQTATVAQENGAIVLNESRKGYGWACLLGIEKAVTLKADIIVFLDGDYSDYPEQLPMLVKPIIENEADLVIGSRALGKSEKGSMTFPQRFGNWLATRLMRIFYGVRYTDLGPFRAIQTNKLLELGMKDKTYGWTIEMQIKAAQKGLKHQEIPVDYRNRIGKSKVSGTVKGTIMAGIKIIGAIFKYKFS
jgi:glycosyltransferase involved in cell wall biosynthesis